MWYCPKKYEQPLVKNVNEFLGTLQGELDDKEARLTLIDFLRANIGLTVELISGVKLAPYQEITKEVYDETATKIKPISQIESGDVLDVECASGTCPTR